MYSPHNHIQACSVAHLVQGLQASRAMASFKSQGGPPLAAAIASCSGRPETKKIQEGRRASARAKPHGMVPHALSAPASTQGSRRVGKQTAPWAARAKLYEELEAADPSMHGRARAGCHSIAHGAGHARTSWRGWQGEKGAGDGCRCWFCAPGGARAASRLPRSGGRACEARRHVAVDASAEASDCLQARHQRRLGCRVRAIDDSLHRRNLCSKESAWARGAVQVAAQHAGAVHLRAGRASASLKCCARLQPSSRQELSCSPCTAQGGGSRRAPAGRQHERRCGRAGAHRVGAGGLVVDGRGGAQSGGVHRGGQAQIARRELNRGCRRVDGRGAADSDGPCAGGYGVGAGAASGVGHGQAEAVRGQVGNAAGGGVPGQVEQ